MIIVDSVSWFIYLWFKAGLPGWACPPIASTGSNPFRLVKNRHAHRRRRNKKKHAHTRRTNQEQTRPHMQNKAQTHPYTQKKQEQTTPTHVEQTRINTPIHAHTYMHTYINTCIHTSSLRAGFPTKRFGLNSPASEPKTASSMCTRGWWQ